MAEKLTRLTHKIAIQMHLVAENCTICSSRSRRPETFGYILVTVVEPGLNGKTSLHHLSGVESMV
jgi:hypothetical protein